MPSKKEPGKESELKIKLAYTRGLKPFVLNELKKYGFMAGEANESLNTSEEHGKTDDAVVVEYTDINMEGVKKLRSVARAYLIAQNPKYHPMHLFNNKSILGNMVEIVLKNDKFKTFKISCAGSDSSEVRGIAKYIKETFSLEERDEADLKIHIIKPKDIWEIGIQVTSRPLSVREYRAENMSGAMDPTIAYAVNSVAHLKQASTYLNIFSGSATLLIEAGECYKNLQKLIGFDNDKKHLSLSIQNIKKAGLIKKAQVKEADIFDKPDFGVFDAIVSDLPFGMVISKNEDLQKLYTAFAEYCEVALKPVGRLVIFTSEYKLMESVLQKSKFKLVESHLLSFITNAGAYLKAKILVCEFK